MVFGRPAASPAAKPTQRPATSPLKSIESHFAIADALRAFAILSVVSFHEIWQAKPDFRGHVLTIGYLGVWGVDCFFVLTGFLLSKPFIIPLLDSTRRLPSTFRFLVRRWLRIYPLYFVAVLISFFVTAWYSTQWPNWSDVIWHLLFIQSYSTTTVFSLNSPLWTMGIDACFYLCLPLAALAMRPVFAVANEQYRHHILYGILALVVTLSLLYRYMQCIIHPDSLTDSAAATVYVRNLFGMAAAFAIGVAIAVRSLEPGTHSKRFYGLLAIIGAGLAVVELLARLDVNVAPSRLAALRYAVVDPFAALSSGLILFAFIRAQFATMSRVVGSSFVTSLAVLSYAIYLFHMPILASLKTFVFQGYQGSRTFVELVAVSLPIIALSAWAAHLLIERPFLTLKQRQREPSSDPPAP